VKRASTREFERTCSGSGEPGGVYRYAAPSEALQNSIRTFDFGLCAAGDEHELVRGNALVVANILWESQADQRRD
jgi:hypothetical protein